MHLDRDLTNYQDRKNPARELRKAQTDAEKCLWSRLRDRRLGGHKFRRQFPIGPFFADFCCLEKKMVIEIDGEHHANTMNADLNRTEGMEELGFHVLRFWNNDVVTNLDGVCRSILIEMSRHSIPLPEGEGGR
jgi:very-short-patch-repair endonuclease